MYLTIAQIEKDYDYIGIDWVRWWYQRNLSIYTNVTKLINTPSERVILLIGGAHLHLLRQFFRESGVFHVEDVNDYLT